MFRKPERKVTVNMHGPFIFVNPGDLQQFYAQMGRMVDDEKDSDDEEAGVQNVKNEARLPQQSDKKDKAPGPSRIQQVTTDTNGIWPAKTLLKPKCMSIASQAAKAAPQRATAPKEPHTFPMPPHVQQAAPVQTSFHPIWKPPVSPPPKADSGVKSMHGDFQGWQYWPRPLLADGNFKEMKYEERHYWDGGERVQSARLEVRRPATMAAGTEDGRRPAWQKPSGPRAVFIMLFLKKRLHSSVCAMRGTHDISRCRTWHLRAQTFMRVIPSCAQRRGSKPVKNKNNFHVHCKNNSEQTDQTKTKVVFLFVDTKKWYNIGMTKVPPDDRLFEEFLLSSGESTSTIKLNQTQPFQQHAALLQKPLNHNVGTLWLRPGPRRTGIDTQYHNLPKCLAVSAGSANSGWARHKMAARSPGKEEMNSSILAAASSSGAGDWRSLLIAIHHNGHLLVRYWIVDFLAVGSDVWMMENI
ncbi:hypothetical protein POSPLADRAFT_1046277 [Postia placenta MAD-698-R-SB12]|uniref:Uncharacterized protein n=1 Tax=Postia placenta MAD-698-R-SB12 TaxID=670580 RepID=A0A1X6N359_9APHY|nr:hypothetical protein POSPLADRAFT_1046277 [Postia placenta MAD-698-R-SB12]OSX62902.1 hypothetical protein POSPLADRAFT_1046277 [Postia placenta MAD-698-R-SB12]